MFSLSRQQGPVISLRETAMSKPVNSEFPVFHRLELRSLTPSRIRLKAKGNHRHSEQLTGTICKCLEEIQYKCIVEYKPSSRSIIIERKDKSTLSEEMLISLFEHLESRQISIDLSNSVDTKTGSGKKKSMRTQIAELFLHAAITGPHGAVQNMLLTAAKSANIPFVNLLSARSKIRSITGS